MTLTYCRNIIRQQDSDRFLLSLFAPYRHRPAIWALFAFNYEIAKTREVVSDTTIGLIRLQWWRDSIASIYENHSLPRHDVIEPLAKAIKQYDLPKELFDNLIYAREFDLEGVAPANMEGLINYCEYTNAPLFKLVLKILGEDISDTVVVDISVYYSIVRTIRIVPYMLKQRRLLLPQDILMHHGVSEQKLFDFNRKENLPKVIEEVLERGRSFRNYKSSDISSKFLKKARRMTELYEQKIISVDFDVFDQRLSVPPSFMALRLWTNV